jgi:hypothetical protein
MKNLSFLLIFLVAAPTTYCNTGSSNSVVTEKVVKYNFHPEKTIKITAEVGQNIKLIQADIDKIKKLKIHHIDLVYTSYKGAASFDQEKLNRSRINKLKSALPQVRRDDPTWKYIEQSGATNIEEAKAYFHGFIIHYGADLSYKHLKKFFRPFQTPPKKFVVNNSKGGTFDCENGATVELPANAVTDANGNPVKGSFTLKYKEFKNPADIVFSGIPMTYNNGKGDDMNFSSVGMYDMRAVQNGKQLKLNKPAEVDFSCTEKAPGVAFYEMDDETGKWTKKKDVEYYEPPVLKYKRTNTIEFEGKEFEWKSNVYDKFTVTRFNDASWTWIMERFEANEELNKCLEKIDETNKAAQLTVEPRALMELVGKAMMEEKKAEYEAARQAEIQKREEEQERIRKAAEERQKKLNRLRAERTKLAQSLLSDGTGSSRSAPNMVQGLNSQGFGVYNCDQLYRMQEPLVLSPTYKDENGKEITSKHVACVVDLNYNGSFSFHPNNITCDSKGKNVILLFTDSKDVYMLSANQFASSNATSTMRPVFRMKNMTGIIKTSDDLKRYLKG